MDGTISDQDASDLAVAIKLADGSPDQPKGKPNEGKGSKGGGGGNGGSGGGGNGGVPADSKVRVATGEKRL